MITAFLGPMIALRLFTVDAIHTGLETSLAQGLQQARTSYVHIDWKDDPQSPVTL